MLKQRESHKIYMQYLVSICKLVDMVENIPFYLFLNLLIYLREYRKNYGSQDLGVNNLILLFAEFCW